VSRRVRFEIIELEEPELGATHLVITIDDKGEEIERFTTEAVEAAREAQSLTLEERFDLYVDRGW
jgi:hypothetical protein